MLYLNHEEVSPTIFPDGTSQIWQIDQKLFYQGTHILWQFESESEIFHLAQLVMLIRSHTKDPIILEMPYLPYGRQDKRVNNKETFALSTFAAFLNSLHLGGINTLDAHSFMARDLINNLIDEFPAEEIGLAVHTSKPDCICYPDAGAKLRYKNHIQYYYDIPTIYGNKNRDPQTGYITDYEIVSTKEDGWLNGKTILIIDDICDGGMTFKLLSDELYEHHVDTVDLYVTHGIFSKGLETLRDSGIKSIFTREGEIDAKFSNVTM